MRKNKIAYFGMLTAAALILGYVESLIPFSFGIQGMKLGLTNVLIMVVLYLSGAKDALLLNVIRVLLNGFLFGNMFGILYSLAGAVFSFVGMVFCKRLNLFSITGVSVIGGVMHNLGQILVAVFALETAGLLYYLPFLIVSGTVTGVLIGILAGEVIKRLPSLS